MILARFSSSGAIGLSVFLATLPHIERQTHHHLQLTPALDIIVTTFPLQCSLHHLDIEAHRNRLYRLSPGSTGALGGAVTD